jgi:UDP-N-acetylmuramyl pentapeptide phosphotransferase/UDP-N-acetylglucosamine-1-phosphate transferase
VVAKRKMGASWLVLVYLLALLVVPAIIALGFIDSFADVRKRLKAAPPDEPKQ